MLDELAATQTSCLTIVAIPTYELRYRTHPASPERGTYHQLTYRCFDASGPRTPGPVDNVRPNGTRIMCRTLAGNPTALKNA